MTSLSTPISEAIFGTYNADRSGLNNVNFPKYAFNQLNYDLLKRLAAEYGLDSATAILFESICNDPENAKFLADLERATQELHLGARPSFSENTRLVIIPGAFHKEHPSMGSGGEAFSVIAAEWGLKAERIELKSLGGVRENMEIVRDFFVKRQTQVGEKPHDIVVSISKGGYEFSRTVEEHPELFSTVKTWINVAGLLRGSLAADQIVGSFWRRALLNGYLRLKKGNCAALNELLWRGPAPASAPKGIPVVNCVGIPQSVHMNRTKSGALGQRYRDIGKHGPNDGATLILDTIVRPNEQPGYIVPLWGADHYFRTFDRVERLVRAILLCLQT